MSGRVRKTKVRRVQAQEPAEGGGSPSQSNSYDDYDPEAEYFDEYDDKLNGESNSSACIVVFTVSAIPEPLSQPGLRKG